MTNAYDESYLDDAMRNLGEAVDYAVNACNVSIGDFFAQFMATGIAAGFAKGVPKYISGLSGTELVHEVFLSRVMVCRFRRLGLSIVIPRLTGADG